MEWDKAAILRRCTRCCEYRALSAFYPEGRVCQACVRCERESAGQSIVRGYALTAKAREWLAAERAAT